MLSSVCRYVVQFTAIVVGCFIFAVSAGAQTNQNQAVEQFLANPGQVLQQYPNGGAELISLIRDVAVAHPEALQTIVGLFWNPQQSRECKVPAAQAMAIGSGLGQAAQILVRTNQADASKIQQAIAGSACEAAKVAFASVTGNVAIGAAGGGGGGAGGTSGGPIGTSGLASGGTTTGSAQTFGGLHYQNTSTNYFTGGGAGGATSSNVSGSVSPH